MNRNNERQTRCSQYSNLTDFKKSFLLVTLYSICRIHMYMCTALIECWGRTVQYIRDTWNFLNGQYVDTDPSTFLKTEICSIPRPIQMQAHLHCTFGQYRSFPSIAFRTALIGHVAVHYAKLFVFSTDQTLSETHLNICLENASRDRNVAWERSSVAVVGVICDEMLYHGGYREIAMRLHRKSVKSCTSVSIS